MANILVVDDEQGIREFLADALSFDGHEVAQAADGMEALRRTHDRAFDLMLTDLKMPGALTGIEEEHTSCGQNLVAAAGGKTGGHDCGRIEGFFERQLYLPGSGPVRSVKKGMGGYRQDDAFAGLDHGVTGSIDRK